MKVVGAVVDVVVVVVVVTAVVLYFHSVLGVAERSSSQGGLGLGVVVEAGTLTQVKCTSTYLELPGHGSPKMELLTGTEQDWRLPHLQSTNIRMVTILVQEIRLCLLLCTEPTQCPTILLQTSYFGEKQINHSILLISSDPGVILTWC